MLNQKLGDRKSIFNYFNVCIKESSVKWHFMNKKEFLSKIIKRTIYGEISHSRCNMIWKQRLLAFGLSIIYGLVKHIELVVGPIITMKATSSEYFPLNSTPLCLSCKPYHWCEDIVSIFGNLEMQYGLYQELYHTFSIRGDFLVSQTTIETANWILCSAIVTKKKK